MSRSTRSRSSIRIASSPSRFGASPRRRIGRRASRLRPTPGLTRPGRRLRRRARYRVLTPEAEADSVERAPSGRPLAAGLARSHAGRWPHARRRGHAAMTLCAAVALYQGIARAGHEATFYPSFYPQEIRIETLDAASAGAGWSKPRVHAYVGHDLFGGGSVPADATAVASLHSYLVLTFDAIYGRYAAGSGDVESRCAAAGRTLRALAPGGADFVPHPDRVNPNAGAYLRQFGLAQCAQSQFPTKGGVAAAGPRLKIATPR